MSGAATISPRAPVLRRRVRQVRDRRDRLRALLRTGEWWNAKPPLMAAVAYAALAATPRLPPIGTALGNLALLGAATFALAGFGYLLNDVGDQDADARLGAANAASALGRRRSALALAGLGLGAALPWIVLPHTEAILGLLALEVALLVAYVLPPLRLKERGLAGIAADALYGYVLPLVVARLVFEAVGAGAAPRWGLVALAAWAFALGVRQILAHQLSDVGADERVGARTHVLRRGWAPSLTRFGRVTVVEAALLPVALVGLGASGPVALAGLAVHAAWVLTTRPRREVLPHTPIRELDVIARSALLGSGVMASFHVRWLPLLLAGALAVRDPSYLIVVAAHALLFTTPLGEWRAVRPALARLRRAR